MNYEGSFGTFAARNRMLSNLNRIYTHTRYGILVSHQDQTFELYYRKLGLYKSGSAVEWGDKFHEYFKKLD
jgi:hypothetical protein